MESIESAIVIRNVSVVRIEERFQSRYDYGHGKEAVFSSLSLGWYIVLKGSMEAMYAGDTRPNLLEGELVTVRIEKQNAIPSQPPK